MQYIYYFDFTLITSKY